MTLPLPAAQRVVVFQLSGVQCAFRLESVLEILPMATLLCPPNRPALIEGFLNLGGSAIPVVRLDRLFGFALRDVELHTPLILVRTPAGPIAFWVERVLDILTDVGSSALSLDATHSFNGCVDAVIGSQTRPIHLLSVDRVLIEKERQRLVEYQAQAQQRLSELARPAEAAIATAGVTPI